MIKKKIHKRYYIEIITRENQMETERIIERDIYRKTNRDTGIERQTKKWHLQRTIQGEGNSKEIIKEERYTKNDIYEESFTKSQRGSDWQGKTKIHYQKKKDKQEEMEKHVIKKQSMEKKIGEKKETKI